MIVLLIWNVEICWAWIRYHGEWWKKERNDVPRCTGNNDFLWSGCRFGSRFPGCGNSTRPDSSLQLTEKYSEDCCASCRCCVTTMTRHDFDKSMHTPFGIISLPEYFSTFDRYHISINKSMWCVCDTMTSCCVKRWNVIILCRSMCTPVVALLDSER